MKQSEATEPWVEILFTVRVMAGIFFFFEVNKLLISFDFNFVFVCNYLFIYFYLSRVIDSHRIGHFRVLSFLMTSFLFKHNFNLHFFNREA